MNSTVDDFLNEINEIAPLTTTTKQIEWQECFDELSGYCYYWNTKTDEVTWSKPMKFKSAKDAALDKTSPHRSVNLPPRKAPLFPSTSRITESVKIYKISDENAKSTFGDKVSSSNGDTRLVLFDTKAGSSKGHPVEEKTTVCLFTNKTPSSSNFIETKTVKTTEKPPKHSLGYSLVAGYSDSEEETEDEKPEEVRTFCPIQPPPPDAKVAHSTLFPIAQPIDMNDFKEPSSPPEEAPPKVGNEFDSKAFQRKRRIGIALVNTAKRVREADTTVEGEERTGFGFSKETAYNNFTKAGGVSFVKSDVNETNLEEKIERTVEKCEMEDKEAVEELYDTLKEKLGFLSEGFSAASPVHVMVIQAETLFTAMKSGDLKLSYLNRWLSETCSNLVKLEKDATPDGWHLQWDRSHKRYYYQNEASGESQWEHPELDVVRRDEAMDICTTPPPQNVEGELSPPLPPVIRSPTPPPPPIISKKTEGSEKGSDNSEPLPPGVDSSESTPKDLDSALDSFYSDIAAIENVNSPSEQTVVDESKNPQSVVEQINVDASKKKKKTKVKLTQGLAMKKKGVSKLVEKWKNVQLHYD